MIRIVKFNRKDRPDLERKAHGIRNNVFVEEQKVDPELEHDEFDDSAYHYLLYYNDIPVATARWRQTEKIIKLERFATLKEYRNKGIGGELVKRMLKDVTPFKKTIYLNSQLKAVSLYERFGFVIEGEIFKEAEIEHYAMRLKIED